MAGVELGALDGKRYVFDKGEVRLVIPDVRDGVRAGAGRKFQIADYSQIEVRLMAFLSQENTIIDALNLKKDIHCHMTSLVYGIAYDLLDAVVVQKDKKHPRYNELSKKRSGVKTVTFGVPYGAGPRRVGEMIQEQDEDGNPIEGMDHAIERAKELIENYFAQAPKLKAWLQEQKRMAQTSGFTCSINGRKRFYELPDRNNPDYEKIMSQIGRYAGNHPIQCVAGSTRIFEKANGYVPIETLSGRDVTVWDGKQWAGAKVAASGFKRLFRVRLMNGVVMECSPNHKFLIRTPKAERWMTAEGLQAVLASRKAHTHKNYRVVLGQPLPAWSLDLNIPPAVRCIGNGARYECLTTLKDLDKLGCWLGRIASDGSVSEKADNQGAVVVLIVAEHEKEVLPKLEEVSACFGGCSVRSVVKPGYTDPVHYICITASSLARQLIAAGIKERIPNFVWRDHQLLSAYLCGLFDGDGGVHPDGAVLTFGGGIRHLSWAQEVQQALLLFGIRSRLRCYPKDGGKSDRGSIRLQIQKYDMPAFCQWVSFLNSIKQKAAEAVTGTARKGTAAYGVAISIRSIEDTGIEVPMYDVVDSETGRFMANGMVVHNSSSADMLKDAMRRLYLMHRGWDGAAAEPWAAPKVLDANLLLVCHDEAVTDCAMRDLDRGGAMLARAMGDAYKAVTMTKLVPPGVKKTFYLRDIWNEVDVITSDFWSKD